MDPWFLENFIGPFLKWYLILSGVVLAVILCSALIS